MRLRSLLPAAVLATVGAAAVAAPTQAWAVDDAGGRRPAPPVVEATAPGLLAESVGYDRHRNVFLVSSMRQGTISTVALDGTVQTLVDDPRLYSTFGLHVDGVRRRVLTVNVDNGVSPRSTPATLNRVAGIGSYDLDTGENQWYVDLTALNPGGGPQFVSEIAIAPDGTAYVNEVYSPVIYRIDRRGHASVLLRDDRLQGSVSIPGFAADLGQTAIAWVPGDNLIVSKADGTLWRVPVHDPTRLSQVALDSPLLPYVDAMRALPDGRLVLVNNAPDKPRGSVQLLTPHRGWRAATVSTRAVPERFPTGVSVGPGGCTYVLFGGILDYFEGHPATTFTLRRVDLD